MTDTYYLNGDTLPTIPVPHECVIEKVRLENQCIVFEFENDISFHDSIKYFKPEAKSLIIKYHLFSDGDFSIYKWKKPSRFFNKNGRYDCIDNNAITKLSNNHLEHNCLVYLSHYIKYYSIIIELISDSSIIINADVDYIEFEWIY